MKPQLQVYTYTATYKLTNACLLYLSFFRFTSWYFTDPKDSAENKRVPSGKDLQGANLPLELLGSAGAAVFAVDLGASLVTGLGASAWAALGAGDPCCWDARHAAIQALASATFAGTPELHATRTVLSLGRAVAALVAVKRHDGLGIVHCMAMVHRFR